MSEIFPANFQKFCSLIGHNKKIRQNDWSSLRAKSKQIGQIWKNSVKTVQTQIFVKTTLCMEESHFPMKGFITCKTSCLLVKV